MFCLNLQKVPPPILPIKIPCKNDLRGDFDDCSYHQLGVFSIKNPTIESEVSWSSLLSFLHFRGTEFTTDGAVTRIEFQLPHLKNFKLKQRSASFGIMRNFKLNKDSQTEFFSQPRVVVSAVSNPKEPKTSVSSVPSKKS